MSRKIQLSAEAQIFCRNGCCSLVDTGKILSRGSIVEILDEIQMIYDGRKFETWLFIQPDNDLGYLIREKISSSKIS